MPSVNRTIPINNHRRGIKPPTQQRDPLLDGVPIEELTDDWIHGLIYGRNRIGKTTLACQFPKPLALIAVEHTQTGGAISVKKIPGITVYRYKTSEQVKTLGERLHSDKTFQSVVVDSGTSLDEIMLAEVCGWDSPTVMNRFKKVTEDEYTERSERMRKVLRTFLDLETKHVLILANEKDHNPPKGKEVPRNALVRMAQSESFFAAAMGAGTTRWTMDGCNCVCQMYMEKEIVLRKRVLGKKGTPTYKEIETPYETGRFVRRLRMQYHPNYAAGVRSADPMNVPEYVEGETPEELYNNLMAVVKGEFILNL